MRLKFLLAPPWLDLRQVDPLQRHRLLLVKTVLLLNPTLRRAPETEPQSIVMLEQSRQCPTQRRDLHGLPTLQQYRLVVAMSSGNVRLEETALDGCQRYITVLHHLSGICRPGFGQQHGELSNRR